MVEAESEEKMQALTAGIAGEIQKSAGGVGAADASLRPAATVTWAPLLTASVGQACSTHTKVSFLCYLTSEYTASLSTKSPEFTGPCFTFMELAPKTLRKFKKYAGNPLALKTSGPSINE